MTLFHRYLVTTQVVRFTVHGWLTYPHTCLCSSFSNLEPWNCEPEKFLVSASSVRSPSQILTSLLDGTLFESIHVPVVRPWGLSALSSRPKGSRQVAKPQYLSRQGGIQSSSLSNLEPWTPELWTWVVTNGLTKNKVYGHRNGWICLLPPRGFYLFKNGITVGI